MSEENQGIFQLEIGCFIKKLPYCIKSYLVQEYIEQKNTQTCYFFHQELLQTDR